MNDIELLFDSESLRQRSLELLMGLTQDEIYQWKQHPCTKYLLLELKADYLDIHAGWEAGNYTTEVADGTVQLNAESLGGVKAIRSLVEHIEELKVNDADNGV